MAIVANESILEQRRSVRRVVDIEALLWSPTMRTSGKIAVMSEVGCRADVDEPVNEGGEMHISFVLPYSEATVRCDARVVWSDQQSIGVEFQRMRDEDRRILARWLETHAKPEFVG